MTIDTVINNLYDAVIETQDATWFDYQGFRWELGHDLCFHPRHILHRAICPDYRMAEQYKHPIPYYPESECECICESLL